MKNKTHGDSSTIIMALIVIVFVGGLGLFIRNEVARNNDPNYRPDLLESIFVQYHPEDSFNETDAYVSTTDGDYNIGRYFTEAPNLKPGTMYCFTLDDANETIDTSFEGNCPEYETPITP